MIHNNTNTSALFAVPAGWRAMVPAAVVAGAAVISGWIIWLPTQSAALTGGFVAAGLLGAAGLWAARRTMVADAPIVSEMSDWSLVRVVADLNGDGVAITDRTGRLVCANDAYCEWFGGAVTPPNLPVDAPTMALLADAGRSAWRAGDAAVAAFTCNGRDMTGTVQRMGRAGDHLLWRWVAHETADPVAEASAMLLGPAGQMLAESGIMAALVSAAGTIRAANSSFRLRAAGGVDAQVEGHDFAAALRVDAHGLIRFTREREGEGATPLRILEVPFDRQSPNAPLLLFLIDEDGGVAERGIALDYVESLLTALPFGMSMVDREGRFLFINTAFAKAAGVAGGAMPSYPSDLVVSEDKAAIGEAIRRHAGGRASAGDISVRLRG
ncbi:MAG: PAS domain-containing protein, partial [Sphingopyxis sp.]